VVAVGEFGRTPKINPAGGRDHHPGCWTMLIGGGPIKGGQVVGESDALGTCACSLGPRSKATGVRTTTDKIKTCKRARNRRVGMNGS